MKLVFSVWGEDIIERDLLRFAHRALDARPAWVAIIKDIEDELTEQFDSEGAHASGGWAQLAASTLAQKAAAGLDPRIMHATLRLRESLTENSEDTIKILDPNFFVFGSDVEYGAYHMGPSGDRPARPPVALNEVAKTRMVKTLQRYMVEGELGAGAFV